MQELTVFGDVDPRAVDQLERCAQEGDAVAAALCADGHVGYSQPIGGVVAYPEHISPSGVGYDIGCIAAGEPVLTEDGFHVPIERLAAESIPSRPGRNGMLGPVSPYLGVVAKGRRDVVRLTLAAGRSVRMTPDHEVRTERGWVRAERLSPRDAVLCPAFVGLPFEPCQLSGAFLRLAGYVNGDGHIARHRRYASIYTSVLEDVPRITRDIAIVTGGYDAPSYVRTRPNGSTEVVVRINKRDLVRQLVEFGCPVGRKSEGWGRALVDQLRTLPAWGRAQYLAGFAGAEATTPAYRRAQALNLCIKQRGADAMNVVTALMESLGFAWAVFERDDMFTGQLQGGEEEQLRFLSQVGFAYATGKARAAAAVMTATQEAQDVRLRRSTVRDRMRALCADGLRVRDAAALVAEETRLTPAACIHLMYRSGTLRVPRGWAASRTSRGECCWLRVESVEPDGTAETYDVVTGDPEHAFVAGGMTVHNCGNKAVRTDILAADLRPQLGRVMDDVWSRVSFGVGRKNDEPVDHPVLDRIRDAEFAPQRALRDLAAKQLGTVGAGNHYVDLFEDEEGFVWVGVHFGSRGFGHKTASGFLALAQGRRFEERAPEGEMDSPPILLHVGSELGQAYIAAMELAGEYAYAGRDTVVDRVLEILGAHSTYEVHNHHNFAWRERHFGTDVWVVRKGCTPAFPGQEGFVGATMGEPSVILRGADAPGSPGLLFSTVHGAGRVMSRTQAAGKVGNRAECSERDCDFWVTWRDHQANGTHCPRHPNAKMVKRRGRIKPGRIDYTEVRRELVASGIELRGGAADEAPAAYKRLDSVLAAHGDTIEIVHRLSPIGVAMAGADTYDPYKD